MLWITPAHLPLLLAQVVANAVTALSDIHEAACESDPSGHSSIFVIDSAVLSKLLIALNECTEWGRIAILSSLSRYRATDEREAEHICERVLPQFQHANGSVVLSAVKVRSRGPIENTFRKLTRSRRHSTGDHDSHAKGPQRGLCEAARAQDGPTIGYVQLCLPLVLPPLLTFALRASHLQPSHPCLLRTRSSMGGVAQHQLGPAAPAGHSLLGIACLLLQIQRPELRQARKVRHHDQIGKREKRRHALERTEGVSL